MKLAHALTIATATIAATIALADTAAATPGTCAVTFQPQNEFSYHAAFEAADGIVTVLIAQQTESIHLPPTSYDIPADARRVLWATRPELAPADPSNPDNYFPKTPKDNGSSLWLGPDCTFTTPYTSAPNWRPSVVIRPGTPAPTTTAPAPTTTSTTPATTTSTAPEPTSTTRPAPITTFEITPSIPEEPPTTVAEVTTTTTKIVVDVPLTPATTTTAPAPPEVPSSSVDLYTATSVEASRPVGTLPHTGSNLADALVVSGVGLVLGLLCIAIGRSAKGGEQ